MQYLMRAFYRVIVINAEPFQHNIIIAQVLIGYNEIAWNLLADKLSWLDANERAELYV